MTHLIDARRLLDIFNESNFTHMSGLILALLDLYLESGPFEFDAGRLSHKLSGSKLSHVNPAFMSKFAPELERYFVSTPAGWAPRPGVLAIG